MKPPITTEIAQTPTESAPEPVDIMTVAEEIRQEAQIMLRDESLDPADRALVGLTWYHSFVPQMDMADHLEELKLIVDLSGMEGLHFGHRRDHINRLNADCWHEIARLSNDELMQPFALAKAREKYKSIARTMEFRQRHTKDRLQQSTDSGLDKQYALSQIVAVDLEEVAYRHSIGMLTEAEAGHAIDKILQREHGEILRFGRDCEQMHGRAEHRKKTLGNLDARVEIDEAFQAALEQTGILWERTYVHKLRGLYHAEGRDDLAVGALPSLIRQDQGLKSVRDSRKVTMTGKNFDLVTTDEKGSQHIIQLKKRPSNRDARYEEEGIGVIYPPGHQTTGQFFRFISLALQPLPKPDSTAFNRIKQMFEPNSALERSHAMYEEYLRMLAARSVDAEVLRASESVLGELIVP